MRSLVCANCETCNNPFDQNRPWQKYCSTRCRLNSPQKKVKTRHYQAKRRNKIDQIKIQSGCEWCGYQEHPAALHFHHHAGEKHFLISGDPKRRWSDILAEIEKCKVLCANCHSVLTCERNHYITKRKDYNAVAYI